MLPPFSSSLTVFRALGYYNNTTVIVPDASAAGHVKDSSSSFQDFHINFPIPHSVRKYQKMSHQLVSNYQMPHLERHVKVMKVFRNVCQMRLFFGFLNTVLSLNKGQKHKNNRGI